MVHNFLQCCISSCSLNKDFLNKFKKILKLCIQNDLTNCIFVCVCLGGWGVVIIYTANYGNRDVLLDTRIHQDMNKISRACFRCLRFLQ